MIFRGLQTLAKSNFLGYYIDLTRSSKCNLHTPL